MNDQCLKIAIRGMKKLHEIPVPADKCRQSSQAARNTPLTHVTPAVPAVAKPWMD